MHKWAKSTQGGFCTTCPGGHAGQEQADPTAYTTDGWNENHGKSAGPSHPAAGVWNAAATWGKSPLVPPNAKPLPYAPAIQLLTMYNQKDEHVCPHKNFKWMFLSSVLHSNSNQMSTDAKYHTFIQQDGIQIAKGMEYCNMDEPWKSRAKQQPVTEGHTVWDYIHMKCQ